MAKASREQEIVGIGGGVPESPFGHYPYLAVEMSAVPTGGGI